MQRAANRLAIAPMVSVSPPRLAHRTAQDSGRFVPVQPAQWRTERTQYAGTCANDLVKLFAGGFGAVALRTIFSAISRRAASEALKV